MHSPLLPAARPARPAPIAAVQLPASPSWSHPDPAAEAAPPAPAPVPEAPAPAPEGPAADKPWWRFGEDGPIFTFGAATSFVFDINQPDSQVTNENRKTYANGQSEESFNIDLVQLGVSGSRSRVSYGVKLDYGDWSEVVSDNVDGDFALQEAFLAIDAGFGVISAGRMPTPLGYEVLEPWANANISRSRAWFFQAVSHDGAALSGEVGGVSLMAAVVNGFKVSENGMNNPDDEYGVIASAGVPVGDADFKLTAVYSDEKDLTRFFELNGNVAGNWERFRYGLDLTWLDGNGHGNPAPPDVTVLDATAYGGATFGHWSGDLRLSYTDQKGTNGNYLTRNSEGIVSFTATGGYEIVDGVVLRAEYRVDSASRDIFDDHDSAASPGGPVGQTDLVNVVQVQLMWTPATGKR
jgi:hypothetical protein